jgi:hypothetical protein
VPIPILNAQGAALRARIARAKHQIHHTHAIDPALDGKPRPVTTSSQACMSDVFMLLSASLGAVAQLGARLNGIQKVKGSNPFSSTKRKPCH